MEKLSHNNYVNPPLVELPIFRNFKITNIKMTKDELFDIFIFEFFFLISINYLHNLIIFLIVKY